MDNFGEMKAALQSDLTVGDESSFFPEETIELSLNRSYRKIGGMFKWPELEDAKKTSTETGQEYYDYPDNWMADSIWRMEVDDEQYGESPDGSPLSFEDYLVWRRADENEGSTDKKWGSQSRRFFIYPVPTDNGTNNITIWGRMVVSAMSDDEDTTIFSYSMPEVNEAIVLEAKAILQNKGNAGKDSQFSSAEAKQIVMVAWNKIRQEQTKYEKNQPFFSIPDFFSRKNKKDSNIGNF